MCIANSGRQINKSKSLLKWLDRIHTSQTTINGKIVIEIITIPTAGAVVLATAITIAEDKGRGRGRGGRGGQTNNSDHLQNVECFNCGKKGHYSTDFSQPRKNNNENSNMVSKADFKNLFQSSLK
jgi:hypothetical protein